MTTPVDQPYKLESDQKVANLMFYTQNAVHWGEAVLKVAVRGSTWLRTNMAPEVICLYNARTLFTTSPGQPKPLAFRELHLFTDEILAYHLIPPQEDPIDYDPTEPNRMMIPATVMVGTFQMDGHLRISTISNLGKFLEVTREEFSALYDVEISNPVMPSLGVMKVHYAQVRQAAGSYAKKA